MAHSAHTLSSGIASKALRSSLKSTEGLFTGWIDVMQGTRGTTPALTEEEEYPTMETPKSTPSGVYDRIRSNRLTSSFVLLGTLSTGILAGSILTHGVSGKESQRRTRLTHDPIVVPVANRALEWLFTDCEAGWTGGGEHQYGVSAEAEHTKEWTARAALAHPQWKWQWQRQRTG